MDAHGHPLRVPRTAVTHCQETGITRAGMKQAPKSIWPYRLELCVRTPSLLPTRNALRPYAEQQQPLLLTIPRPIVPSRAIPRTLDAVRPPDCRARRCERAGCRHLSPGGRRNSGDKRVSCEMSGDRISGDRIGFVGRPGAGGRDWRKGVPGPPEAQGAVVGRAERGASRAPSPASSRSTRKLLSCPRNKPECPGITRFPLTPSGSRYSISFRRGGRRAYLVRTVRLP